MQACGKKIFRSHRFSKDIHHGSANVQSLHVPWFLVWYVFSFCWYHASHPSASATEEAPEPSEPEAPFHGSVLAEAEGTGKKISEGKGIRPQVSWPAARRSARGWLEPWIMLRRYWSGWSPLPPPSAVQLLLSWLSAGMPSVSTVLLDPQSTKYR